MKKKYLIVNLADCCENYMKHVTTAVTHLMDLVWANILD